MGRAKRSEKVIAGRGDTSEAVRQAEEVARQLGPREPQDVISAFCVVCGHSIPERRAIRRSTMGTLESQPYFESIEWDPGKPFGVRRSGAGKGSFKDWEYIGPEDAPELFAAMKTRILAALGELVAKGWISREEVLAAVSDVSQGGAETGH